MSIDVIWLLSIAIPLVAAAGILIRPLSRAALLLAPWTALPALALALWAASGERVELPWLFLETRLGLDTTGRIFLLFTALLWTVAGWFATAYLAHDRKRQWFWFFFLLTMSGNFGLIIAQDIATFYVCFVFMTFAAYGLIIHDARPQSYRAGKVYIVLAVIGEAMLLGGILFTAFAAPGLDLQDVPGAVAASPWTVPTVLLLLAGFGVKAGAVPLHVWLPLAHPVAPTPASAVLSGAMIKAGLLGWLRFLPLGEASLPGWGALVIILGLGAAFYAVVVGVVQDEPKTNLAYSSISQMGIMIVGVGVGLAEPAAAPLVTTALVFYALHHGLAKGALFLGVGVAAAKPDATWPRWLVGVGLLFATLTLAGAPLTSGSVAKAVLTGPAAMAPAPWEQWLGWLLPLTAVGTTLLMGRFLWLVRPGQETSAAHPLTPGLWAPWTLLLAVVAVAAWFVPLHFALDAIEPLNVSPGYLWAGVWPIIAGALLLWGARQLHRRKATSVRYHIAAGDVLLAAEWTLGRAVGVAVTRIGPALASAGSRLVASTDRWHLGGEVGSAIGRMERWIGRFGAAGILLLGLITLLFVVLVGS